MKKIHILKNLLRFGLLLCFALASFSCGSENDEKSKEAKTDTAGKTGTDTTSRNESHGHTHDHDSDEHHDEDDETGDALSGLLDGDLLKILGEYATILEELDNLDKDTDNLAAALLGAAKRVALDTMNLFLDELMEDGWQEDARDAFHESIQEDHPIVTNEASAHITRILKKLIEANELEDADGYEIFLIEGEDPNAFAIVGGYYYMTTAMYEIMKDDESQLACIIGHELAHVTEKHCEKKAKVLAFAGRFGDFPAMAAQTGLWLTAPFSQNDEYEADEVGAEMAETAGYDPKAAAKALERALGDHEHGDDFEELFRTHPYPKKRIKKLEETFE
jgi:hypothetical protein